MRIKLTIDGANESELRALLVAHNAAVRGDVGPQPCQAFGSADTHGGRPFVGVEGPERYGVETYALTPAGAELVLAALKAS